MHLKIRNGHRREEKRHVPQAKALVRLEGKPVEARLLVGPPTEDNTVSSKHFNALAEALRWEKPDGYGDEYRGWERAVGAVADVCQVSNSNFHRQRFLAACGCLFVI